SVHFKLRYNGEARRFVGSRSNDQLMAEVKERVATIVRAPIENVLLSWKDVNSAAISHPRIPLESPDDLRQAIEHIMYFDGLCDQMKNKPPCVHLEVTLAPAAATPPKTAAAAAIAAPSVMSELQTEVAAAVAEKLAASTPQLKTEAKAAPESKPAAPAASAELQAEDAAAVAEKQAAATTPTHRSCSCCNESFTGYHVRCPIQPAHRYCFDCTGKSIMQLVPYSYRIVADLHCPSGEKCAFANERPWKLTEANIKTILGEDFEEFDRLRNAEIEEGEEAEGDLLAWLQTEAAAVKTVLQTELAAAKVVLQNAAAAAKKHVEAAAASCKSAAARATVTDAAEEEPLVDPLAAAEQWLLTEAAAVMNKLQTEVAAAKVGLQGAAETAQERVQTGAAAAKSGLTAAAAVAKVGLQEVKERVQQICEEVLQNLEEKFTKEKKEEKECEECTRLEERVKELERQLKMMKEDRLPNGLGSF
ncbi:hypothetical protein PENTCL1PPCAC_1681, partial [Pristionchus entomophagus]